jgi:spermidine/putrescine transport system substrate-binding protein
MKGEENMSKRRPNLVQAGRGLSRRDFLRLSAAGVVTGIAGSFTAGCVVQVPAQPAAPQEAEGEAPAPAEEEKILNVLAFSGYEEPGMLEPFEEETGIKVNLKIHDGIDDEMVALIQTSPPGTWDVMTPTSAFVPNLAKEGDLLELDPADYPLDDYLSPIDEWPPCYMDGKMYGLLNRFGYYGITYNSDQFTADDFESYDMLLDPKLTGKIALFDWFLPNMGVISKWLGFDPPYQLNDEQFAQVKEKLFELRPQVGLIGGTAQTTQALASGEFWVAIAGEFVQAGLFVDGHPYLATVPKEGGVTWDQAVIILENTPRPNNAIKFLQYVAGPEFQAKLAVARTYYSMVPNRKAATLLTEEQRELLNLDDLETFEQRYMANLSPRERPENIDDWSTAWEEFKAI